MKRTIITLFAILALAMAGGLLAQSSTTGTAPQGTALSDPGQQSNNLNKPENTNPSPANTNGMTAGTKPYTQPTGTAPSTTPSTPDQATSSSTATSTTTTTDTTTSTPSSSYGTTGTTDTDSTAGMSGHHKSGRLPRTASDLPLLAAFGALALSAGFVVRKRRDV